MSDRVTPDCDDVDPQLAGDHGIVVQHCAVFGRLETPVGRFWVGRPRPDARHPTSVTVVLLDPRTARRATATARTDSLRYLTIETGGRVAYDSRGTCRATWPPGRRRAAPTLRARGRRRDRPCRPGSPPPRGDDERRTGG